MDMEKDMEEEVKEQLEITKKSMGFTPVIQQLVGEHEQCM